MKRFLAFVCVLLVCIVGGVFYYSERPLPPPPPQKVGVLMMGSRENSSWNEAQARGIEKTAEERGAVVVWRYNVVPSEAGSTVEKLIEDGCRIIVGTAPEFDTIIHQMALQYPKVSFMQAGSQQEANNLLCYTGRFYQTNYLCGLVAGRFASSGELGFVGSNPRPEVIRMVNAFTIGVRKANPEAKVYLRYAGSWIDDAAGREAADSLMQAHPGIQVIAGQVGFDGYISAAKQRGIYAIGCNIDLSRQYPETLLTAPVWNWEVFFRRAMLETAYGRASSRLYVGTIDSGLYSISQTPLLREAEAKDPTLEPMIRREYESIVEGSFDAFYGPVVDSKGVLQVQAGENLGDEVLFGTLDWYVEGVQLDE